MPMIERLAVSCEQAYEMLSILEGTSMMAQQAMHKGTKLKHEDSHSLNFYFDKVGVCTFQVPSYYFGGSHPEMVNAMVLYALNLIVFSVGFSKARLRV